MLESTPGPQPALLVFTLGAARESRRRRLLPAPWGRLEEKLHRACLDAALNAGRLAGCRLVVSSPQRLELPVDVEGHEQRGQGFAGRLRRFLDDAFDEGGGPVILVGSDVPGLTPAHLRHALQQVGDDPDRVVIGPSPDGGFYLLAAARPLDEALAEVSWCTPRALASLRRALARQGRDVVLLAPLADLDGRGDLEAWLARRPVALSRLWHRLRAEIRLLLGTLRRLAHLDLPPALDRAAVRIPPLRAPPLPF